MKKTEQSFSLRVLAFRRRNAIIFASVRFPSVPIFPRLDSFDRPSACVVTDKLGIEGDAGSRDSPEREEGGYTEKKVESKAF